MRVLLADDRVKVRAALRLLLEQDIGLEVVGEAADTVGVLSATVAKQPDLILLDWELPGIPAGELLPLLRFLVPQVRIVALSVRPGAAQAAVAAGADAFIDKGDPPEQVLTILQQWQRDGDHDGT